jgi:hypothetical protein
LITTGVFGLLLFSSGAPGNFEKVPSGSSSLDSELYEEKARSCLLSATSEQLEEFALMLALAEGSLHGCI